MSKVSLVYPSKDINLLEFIAYVARISNPSNQHNNATAERLVRYLAKHKHWSPFEMVNICLEIETTRDIVRQILRHRSFFFQEFSQRYADPTEDLGFVIREVRMQDSKNRQSSLETDDTRLVAFWENRYQSFIRLVQDHYSWATGNGIAKEQARAFLPEGFTKSRLYMNGTVRSWIHYIELRTGPETQKEHRIVAQQCADAIKPLFPLITDYVQS